MTASDAPFPLEPLRLGESLDAGFRLWRNNFIAFFTLSLIAVVPSSLLSGWYQANNVLGVDVDGSLLVVDPGEYLRNSFVFSLAGLFVLAVMWAALMYFGVNAYTGNVMLIGDAISGGLRRILPFVGLALLYWLMVGFGLVAFIIPGIFLAVRFILAFPTFFAEGTSATRSLSRGGALAAGRWWRIFGLLVISWLIVVVVAGVVGALIGGFLPELTDDNIASYFYTTAVVGGVVEALFMPLIPAMMIVAYYDGRVRNEGFDIEFMASRLDDDGIVGPEVDETGGGLIR